MDNYSVIDHSSIHPSSKNVASRNKDGIYTFSKKFLESVDKLKKKRPNNHIFGSSEYLYRRGPLSNDDCSSVEKLLLGNDKRHHWKLHIIFTYRRLFDSLPSEWNQYFKQRRDTNNLPKGQHKDWPEDGGNHIIPFDEWVWKKLEKDEFLDGYYGWKSCSDSTAVVNFHDNVVHQPSNGTGTVPVAADLTTNFVCNGIIGASHTCSYLLLREKKKDKIANPSVSSQELGFEMLAVHAHESGLIPAKSSWKRQKVKQKIVDFVKSNKTISNSLPMRCPNATTLQSLYLHSLKYEKAVLELENKNETQQRLDFDKGWKQAIDKQKFCSLDVEELVKREEWKIFFKVSFQ